MQFLIYLLAFKIFVSLIVLIYPLFFKTAEQVNAGMAATADEYIYRLYGVAILALLVAYGYGIQLALGGQYPWGVVLMGLVSNGGATVVMLLKSGWQRQKKGIILFGGIFLGFVYTALVQGLGV